LILGVDSRRRFSALVSRRWFWASTLTLTLTLEPEIARAPWREAGRSLAVTGWYDEPI
jgi:hypothetical protein